MPLNLSDVLLEVQLTSAVADFAISLICHAVASLQVFVVAVSLRPERGVNTSTLAVFADLRDDPAHLFSVCSGDIAVRFECHVP